MIGAILLRRLMPFLIAALGSAQVAWAEPAPRRVAIVRVQATGLSDENIAAVPDLVAAELAKLPGFVSVTRDEVARAVAKQGDRSEDTCARDEACLVALAAELKADYLIRGAVEETGKAFSLTLEGVDLRSPGNVKRATETMKRLKSLGLNVPLVLKQILPTEALVAEAPKEAAPAAARQRVMVLDLQATGMDAKLIAPLTDAIAREISKHPDYDVASSDDVRRISALQAAQQEVGCTQDEACLTEISKKLDADLVVNGSVGMVGGSYVLNLTLLRPKSLGNTGRAFQPAKRIEDLPGAVAPCLASLFKWSGGAQTPEFHVPKGKKLSFAVMDLKPTGLSPETAQNLTQVLSVEVKGVEGASVVSKADISAIVSLESVKTAAGCDTDSCMAEIGGALGVDRLISGDAGKLGSIFMVNLRLIDVRTGTVENRIAESYQGDEEQLLRAVRRAARALLGLQATGTGRIAITASANAADVFVDDQKRGKAPLPVPDLALGRHSVRVSQSGYFDWQGEVYVDPSETTTVWAQLKERPQAWYQKWWVWTIAGVAVAGATVGAVSATRAPPTVGHGTITVQ